MNYFIALSIALLIACKPTTYKQVELSPLEMAQAECEFLSQNARSEYFPNNVFLNWKAQDAANEACMRSKGYAAISED